MQDDNSPSTEPATRVHRRLLRHKPWSVVGTAWPGRADRAAASAVELAASSCASAASVPPSTVTLGQACAVVGVSPYVLRRLLEEFADLLPSPIAVAGERRLNGAVMGVLGQLVRWRGEGLSPQEIRVRLGDLQATSSSAEGAPSAPAEPLRLALDALREELQRTEHRQAEDRDRLLTLLMRTNQELQQLRHELAMRPRRDRRRGLWDRLFRS